VVGGERKIIINGENWVGNNWKGKEEFLIRDVELGYTVRDNTDEIRLWEHNPHHKSNPTLKGRNRGQ